MDTNRSLVVSGSELAEIDLVPPSLGCMSLDTLCEMSVCRVCSLIVQGSPALGKFYIVTDGGWQVGIRRRLDIPTV